MREIKFRFWDLVEKKMVLFDLVSAAEIAAKILRMYPIMQFTGLHDAKGVEIYEGDVVRTIEEFGDEEGSNKREIDQVVEFGGGAFYPICSKPEGEWEVIGNIMENPELLK